MLKYQASVKMQFQNYMVFEKERSKENIKFETPFCFKL